MSMKKMFFAVSVVVCMAFLTACHPFRFINSFLVEESTNDPVVESAAEQRREDLSGYGYRALKSDEERRIYSILDVCLEDGNAPHFAVDNDGTTDYVSDVLEMYKSDHPEVFWIDDSYGYEYITYATYTEINLLLSVKGDELADARETFERTVDEIIGAMPEGLSDYEKELYINDTLISRCEYDTTAAEKEKPVGNAQNAYGALVEGKAVCEGYARAFQLLCSCAQIDCVPINGTCEGSDSAMDGNHIWDAVCLDNEWYYVDPTWNDFKPEDADYVLTDIEKHLYFNVTTEQIKKDHTITPVYGGEGEADFYNAFIPDCTAETYNYFHYSIPLLSDLDDCEDLQSSLVYAAAAGKGSFAFRISGSLDYDDTVTKIIDSYAANWFAGCNAVNDGSHQLSDACMVYAYEQMNVAAFSLDYR